MSGVQAVTVLGRYPLSWPSDVSSVLNAVGGAFSVAGDVVSFRCSMDLPWSFTRLSVSFRWMLHVRLILAGSS